MADPSQPEKSNTSDQSHSSSTCATGNLLVALLKLLELEKVEENIFCGQSQDLVGLGNVFGGQVLGQALSAASQTVPQERSAHSLHAYFMRLGDASRPIVYTVDRIRDGRSFTTRRVIALQKGRAIFSMAASFQIDEAGFDHQDQMPNVPGPEGIPTALSLARQVADQLPENIRQRLVCEKPIEMRPINPVAPFAPEKMPPENYVWFRAISPMPDDSAIHRYMLAYASDFNLVATTLYPHGHTYWQPHIQAASLDHAMWFHRDFRMDDWMLHVITSPNASEARGLSFGRIFTRQGVLVASVAQEGLIRNRKVRRSGA